MTQLRNHKTINNWSPICLCNVIPQLTERNNPLWALKLFIFIFIPETLLSLFSGQKSVSVHPILYGEFGLFCLACNRLPPRNSRRGRPAVRKPNLNFVNPSVIRIPLSEDSFLGQRGTYVTSTFPANVWCIISLFISLL